MKSNFMFLIFAATCLNGMQEPNLSPTNSVPQAELKVACTTLIAEPLDPSGLQVLLDYSRSTSGIPQIKSRAMAVYALSALAKGDTNLFARAQRSHAANFSSDRELIKYRPDSCFRPCSACRGEGHIDREITCATCKGVGKCLTCNGTGKWQTETAMDSRIARERKQSSVMKCSKCRGTCLCPDCNGITVTQQKCEQCKGDGSIFERPRDLFENYQSLLVDIVTMIQSKETVAERIRQAKAETNRESRMRSFEKLLSDFRNLPEMAEIERLLVIDKTVIKEDAEKRFAADQKIEREIATLRLLKTADNASGAIVTLREYLAANPDSPHKLEIQSVMNECVARVERKRDLRKFMYLGGGLFVILFGLSCIQINYSKNTLLPSYVPGGAKRKKPEAEQFTDPLALTAKESRSRVKTKTANIKIED